VADFATSSATDGKVRMTLDAGQQVPAGWLLDSAGRPTTEPADLYDGGALLPSAGHKGSALGLLVEILGGVLAGEGCASTGGDPGNGFVTIVIDPTAFTETPFASTVDGVIEAIESSRPADGFDRVCVPGGPELAAMKRRRVDGIPVSPTTWDELAVEAERQGIDLEQFLGERG
jgi:uncharacterized oxidoreductase